MSSATANRSIRFFIETIKKFPGVMSVALYCERRWSGPWTKLIRAVSPVSFLTPMKQYKSIAPSDHTERAGKIFYDLNVAIEKYRKGDC